MTEENIEDIFQFGEEIFESKETENDFKNQKFVPRNYFPGSSSNDEETLNSVKKDSKYYKYYADYLYYQGKYKEALIVYKELLESYKDNSVMTRNIQESITWCFIKCDQKDEAKSIGEGLLKESTTFEHHMSSHFLLNVIHNKHQDPNELIEKTKNETDVEMATRSVDKL